MSPGTWLRKALSIQLMYLELSLCFAELLKAILREGGSMVNHLI